MSTSGLESTLAKSVLRFRSGFHDMLKHNDEK